MHIAIPFCSSIAAPSFYQDFVEGIEAAAAALGHSSERIAFASLERLDQAELDRFFRWSRRSRCDLVLDLCCWGYGLSRARLWRNDGSVGAPIFESLGARYCALLYDQPYFQPLAGIESDALVVGYPDQAHAELIPLIYPQLRMRAGAFVPPATRLENDRSSARWAGKSPHVLYVGNLAPHALSRFWDHVPHREAYDAVADALIADPDRPLHRSVIAALRELRLELPAAELVELLRALEYWLRQQQRHRVVTAVARSGLPMIIYGSGWDSLGLPANAEVRSPIDYRGLMEAIASARLALDVSTYLGGANDRVFNFAVNRTAFFTNARAWLREAFGADGGAHFYSLRDASGVGDQMAGVLARPAELEESAARAHETALAGHLWTHRLQTVLQAAF
ncbi:MAG: glycosyltransferase family 1 protein [Betaproteobacteria bacterium]|nr:glycosyltransferase family 1 protein [Betaproteobacteria bacterium]